MLDCMVLQGKYECENKAFCPHLDHTVPSAVVTCRFRAQLMGAQLMEKLYPKTLFSDWCKTGGRARCKIV